MLSWHQHTSFHRPRKPQHRQTLSLQTKSTGGGGRCAVGLRLDHGDDEDGCSWLPFISPRRSAAQSRATSHGSSPHACSSSTSGAPDNAPAPAALPPACRVPPLPPPQRSIGEVGKRPHLTRGLANMPCFSVSQRQRRDNGRHQCFATPGRSPRHRRTVPRTGRKMMQQRGRWSREEVILATGEPHQRSPRLQLHASSYCFPSNAYLQATAARSPMQ